MGKRTIKSHILTESCVWLHVSETQIISDSNKEEGGFCLFVFFVNKRSLEAGRPRGRGGSTAPLGALPALHS